MILHSLMSLLFCSCTRGWSESAKGELVWIIGTGSFTGRMLFPSANQQRHCACMNSKLTPVRETGQSAIADFDPGCAVLRRATWRVAVNNSLRRAPSPLCENVTSSSKPEVHNILHCRCRRTEPRPPKVTCRETFVPFGRVVYETCDRTDRHALLGAKSVSST